MLPNPCGTVKHEDESTLTLATITYIGNTDMTHQERARNADRVNNRLTDLLEKLVMTNPPARAQAEHKAPTFDGEENMEYFVLRFTGVSTANDWGKYATLLHLRKSLKD